MQVIGPLHYGRAGGIVEGFGLIPGLLGPLLLGVCVDQTGSYVPGFLAVMGAFVVSIMLLRLGIPPGSAAAQVSRR